MVVFPVPAAAEEMISRSIVSISSDDECSVAFRERRARRRRRLANASEDI